MAASKHVLEDSATPPPYNGFMPNAPIPEQARQQLATITETAALFYQTLDAIQQAQQRSVQRTVLRLQQAADQMRESRSATEMMALQSVLLKSNFQEISQFMLEMTLAMVRQQETRSATAQDGAAKGPHAAARNSHTADNPVSGGLSAASEAANAAAAATAAMWQSWTSVMNGSPSSSSSAEQGSRHH